MFFLLQNHNVIKVVLQVTFELFKNSFSQIYVHWDYFYFFLLKNQLLYGNIDCHVLEEHLQKYFAFYLYCFSCFIVFRLTYALPHPTAKVIHQMSMPVNNSTRFT